VSNKQEQKFEKLRFLAEQILQQNGNQSDEVGTELTELLHELRVHQVELEIQNEELQRAYSALERTRQEFTDLFDYAPLIYLVLDVKGRIIQSNLTAVTKFGLTRQQLYTMPLSYLVANHNRDQYYIFHRSLVKDKKSSSIELWFDREDMSSFYGRIEVVRGTDDDDTQLLVAITDITERKIYQNQLESILELDKIILNNSYLDEVIEGSIHTLSNNVEADYTAIVLFDHDNNLAQGYVCHKRPEDISQFTSSMDNYTPVSKWNGKDAHVIESPDFLPREIRLNYPFYMIVPIYCEDTVRGMIVIGTQDKNAVTSLPLDFAQQVAVQLGIGIQQWDLSLQLQQYTHELESMVKLRGEQLNVSRESEREQQRFAEAMLSIVKQINQSLDLPRVLELILTTLETVVDYDGARIIVLPTEESDIIGLHQGELQVSPLTELSNFTVQSSPIHQQMATTRQAVILPDQMPVEPLSDEPDIQSYIGIPIQLVDRLLGFIDLYHRSPSAFDQNDIDRLEAFAEHACVAVNNAHLYRKGQELATQQERQRIARDLHDAISQLIFSLSIISEPLPNIIKKGKLDKAQDLAKKLNIIANSANAEMRLLLLELRPLNFGQISMKELLYRLRTAFRGRHESMKIDVDIEEPPSLEVDVKTNLYRIAQEAINNVGKHAKANHVVLKLWMEEATLHMTITDNGIGFDVNQSSSGHGLNIMAERANNIDATIDIKSEPDKGTTIHLIR